MAARPFLLTLLALSMQGVHLCPRKKYEKGTIGDDNYCFWGHFGEMRCHENEGDCDRDSHCFGDLVCGHNNCPKTSEFDATDDCCTQPPSLWCQECNGCCDWGKTPW